MPTLSLWLVLAHYLGDWRFQSNWMAQNKSKKLEALTAHCFVYSIFFLPFGWKFALATFYLHFFTDMVTSRITSRNWFVTEFGDVDDRLRSKFFKTIGWDQLIHYFTLAYTYKWLVG